MPLLTSHDHFAILGLVLSLIANPMLASSDSLTEAESLFNARRYAEAQPLFEDAITAEPDNTRALLYLGKLAAKRGERALAVGYLERATPPN